MGGPRGARGKGRAAAASEEPGGDARGAKGPGDEEGGACHGVPGFGGRELTGVGSGGPEGSAGAGGEWPNGRFAPEAF